MAQTMYVQRVSWNRFVWHVAVNGKFIIGIGKRRVMRAEIAEFLRKNCGDGLKEY